MLLRHVGILALSASAYATFACSSESDSNDGTGAAAGTAGAAGAGGGGGSAGDALSPDPVEPGVQPPDDPGSPPATGTAPTTIAVRKLFLGDTDTSGAPSASAWKDLGYNLDGIISSKTGSNHCTPVRGANPATVQTDGTDGIDNSFGANLVPLILSVAPDASTGVNMSLENGEFSLLLHMKNLGAEPTQVGIDSLLYAAAPRWMLDGMGMPVLDAMGKPVGDPPKWDGTDTWPVVFELLEGGDITKPRVKFPAAYMVDGTWVSGSRGDINLTISLSGVSLVLLIRNAVVTMELDGTGASASATGGVIAGVLKTEELIKSIQSVAGTLMTSLCDGSTFESIAQQIRSASDIMADGTNGDSATTCDGISVGLGFDGQAVVLGGVADPVAPAPDPCAGL